ncbi:RNA-binding S4 domain-containing protein [Oceanobacter kriegii]|uniref:RNA-binding S4 domain-containing protein n=1 Tax=Oceanobacter kriegii TaxID=64972 RepID=UPI0004092807|nr:RNA-binding S4 domain-containing protein [Oceanobacter kriegii]
MQDIIITREPVELFKILKFENIASSGGEAKLMIENGEVLLNGELETQKRKKILNGDVIEIFGEQYKIVLAGE